MKGQGIKGEIKDVRDFNGLNERFLKPNIYCKRKGNKKR